HSAFKRMLLPGQVSYPQHVGYVKGCDIAVSPALMENFSMAIVEAAYLGLPVVAFNRGGNADIITDGKNGYLVADVTTMVKKATLLLNSPKPAVTKLATKNYTRQKFDTDLMLDGYLRVMLGSGGVHA